MTFQLQYVQWSTEGEKHDQNSTWNASLRTLLEDEDFGQALSHDNNWMTDDIEGHSHREQIQKMIKPIKFIVI